MSVSVRAYETLRQRITEGRYRPHQRLVETELAGDLDASRTPVRQALQRLELEGLVIASRQGWTVREHSLEDIQRIYDVRMALEGYAARLAALHATKEQLQAVKAAHENLASAESGSDRSTYQATHDQFHTATFEAANNDVLKDAILQYREHPFNRRVAHLYSPDELDLAANGHGRLVAALTDGDADEAEMIIREHLELAREVTARRFADTYAW